METDIFRVAKSKFMNDLISYVEQLDDNRKPDYPDLLRIVDEALADIMDIVKEWKIEDGFTPQQMSKGFQPQSKTMEPYIKIKLPSKKDWCIITHMALAAAILAAWVASGGTLTIGATAAGVTISSELYAALAGGASGRVIAEILCD